MTQQNTTTYAAHDHLIKIKGKDGQTKDYYPAAWRLYELRLRFPNITVESEIVHLDIEHNFVIIKAIIFDGKSYEEAERRASSFKQGPLNMLDKVETAAKARAARDFGVSTELALDSEPEEDIPDVVPPVPPRQATNKAKASLSLVPPEAQPTSEVPPLVAVLHEMYIHARDLGLAPDLIGWEKLKVDILGEAIHDEKMSVGHVEQMRKGLAERKQKKMAKKS
jgi:hypothetical protein